MGNILTIGQQVIVRGTSDASPAAAGVFVGVDEYGRGVIENTINTRHNGRIIATDKFYTRHSIASIQARD